MDDYFDESPISGIREFQPTYINQTIRGYLLLSTYFGIPDILVLEKYIGCPLRPKKVRNINLKQIRGDTGNDVMDFIRPGCASFNQRMITIKQYNHYKWVEIDI